MAKRAFLGGGRGRRRFTLQLVGGPDQEKDRECDDYKIDDVVEKYTVVDGGVAGCLGLGQSGVMAAGKIEDRKSVV